jgi:hypothetical protein
MLSAPRLGTPCMPCHRRVSVAGKFQLFDEGTADSGQS